MKRFIFALLAAAVSFCAFAQQSCPGWAYGYKPSPAEWCSAYAGKLDYNAAGLPVTLGGTGATTFTGPLKGNGTAPFSAAAAADIYGLWSGSCDSTHFLRGDGTCATAGNGSVNSGTINQFGYYAGTGTAISGISLTGVVIGNGASAPTAISTVPTGATGTGNLVYSISPTFTGTVNAAGMTVSSGANGVWQMGSGSSTLAGLYIENSLSGLSGFGGIWSTQVTPSSTNYSFISSGSITVINGSSSAQMNVGGNNIVNATSTGAAVTGVLSATGHTTFEGVTSTGATGTGNLVYSASPTFTGTITGAALTATGAVTPSQTVGIVGTTTNNSAQAGSVGEIWRATCPQVTSGASIAFTSASPTVGTWSSPPWAASTAPFVSYACPFQITANAPTGLSTATNYWAVPITSTTFKVATSMANALAGTFANTSGTSSTANLTTSLVLATNTPLSVAGMTLTAGDWDCTSSVQYIPGATTSVTNFQQGVGSSSVGTGFLGSYSDDEYAASVLTSTNNPVRVSPVTQVLLASTTAYYTVAIATFTVSTMNAAGDMRCRRVR